MGEVPSHLLRNTESRLPSPNPGEGQPMFRKAVARSPTAEMLSSGFEGAAGGAERRSGDPLPDALAVGEGTQVPVLSGAPR